jgi:hypothetical protein
LLVAIFVGFGIYMSTKLLLPIIPAVFDLSPQPQETLSLKNVIVSEIFKLSDAILFFCLISFLLSLVFSSFSLSHEREIEFLSLTPIRLSDVILAKFAQVFIQVTLLVSSFVILSFVLYWIAFFKTLRRITFLHVLILDNIAYLVFAPIILFLLVFISVGLGFSLALLVVFILHKLRLSVNLKTPTKWMLIIFVLFLSFTIFTIVSSSQIVVPHLNFVTMGIANMTRPRPHFLYTIKTILILLFISFSILAFVYFISEHFGEFMLIEEPRAKVIKEKPVGRRTYLLRNLPQFVEKDLKLFFRGDKSLKWFISDVAGRLFVILICIIPISQQLGSLTFFGLKFDYISFYLIFTLVLVLSVLFTYSYFSEGRCIYLMKLSPLNTKDFILLKMYGTLVISVPLMLLILIIVFSLSVKTTYPWYVILAFLQIFIVFEWLLIESVYFTIIFTKYNTDTLSNSRNIFDTRSSFLLGIINLATFAAWFFVYKFSYSLNIALSILVLALEVLLPILLFNSILLKKAVSKIESLEL